MLQDKVFTAAQTKSSKHETGMTYASFNSLVSQEIVQNKKRGKLLHPWTEQVTQL